MLWEYLKFFHIIAAFMMVGGIMMSEVVVRRARKTTDPQTFGTYMGLGRTSGITSSVGLVLASIFGVLTAWRMGLPLTTTGWLNASYGIAIVATLVPPLTFVRWERQASALMPQAVERGEVLPEQQRLIGGPQFIAVNAFMSFLLVLILVLMVFRPF